MLDVYSAPSNGVLNFKFQEKALFVNMGQLKARSVAERLIQSQHMAIDAI